MAKTYFKDSWETSGAFFDVPVSIPVIVPDIEDVEMNGFAWSDEYGLVVGLDSAGGTVSRLEESSTTIDVTVSGT